MFSILIEGWNRALVSTIPLLVWGQFFVDFKSLWVTARPV